MSSWLTIASTTRPPPNPLGTPHQQHHADAAVIQSGLGAGEGEPVIGGADHERVVGEAEVVQAVQDRPYPLVQRAGAGLERGHVRARAGRVREVGRRQRVERVAHGGRHGEVAVGLEEADRHEEGLVGGAERLDRDRRHLVGVVRVDLDHLVVADHARVLRDVLLADQHRAVAGALAQRVDQVLVVVVQRPAAVREAEHAVVVAVLAGQEGGPAARAGGCPAEGLPEEDALVREELDVRRGDLVAVGLDVAPGVVRVDVEDVGRLQHARAAPPLNPNPGGPDRRGRFRPTKGAGEREGGLRPARARRGRGPARSRAAAPRSGAPSRR